MQSGWLYKGKGSLQERGSRKKMQKRERECEHCSSRTSINLHLGLNQGALLY